MTCRFTCRFVETTLPAHGEETMMTFEEWNKLTIAEQNSHNLTLNCERISKGMRGIPYST